MAKFRTEDLIYNPLEGEPRKEEIPPRVMAEWMRKAIEGWDLVKAFTLAWRLYDPMKKVDHAPWRVAALMRDTDVRERLIEGMIFQGNYEHARRVLLWGAFVAANRGLDGNPKTNAPGQLGLRMIQSLGMKAKPSSRPPEKRKGELPERVTAAPARTLSDVMDEELEETDPIPD